MVKFDLKCKISENIEVILKKCNNIYPTPTNQQRLLKVERECGYFKSREKGCEMAIDKKIVCVCLDGRELVRVWNGNKL